VVDDGPADGGLHHQLPDAQHARGCRANLTQGPEHRRAAVFVDHQRLPGRDHAAAAVRLRHGHHRAEDGVRHLRDCVVLRQHGARPCRQLADALRSPRAAGVRRGLGQSRRDEGNVGMVPGNRARPRRRFLQHGRVARVDAGGTPRRMGDPDAQLAVRVHDHRRDRSRLGGTVAHLLQLAVEAPRALRTRARLHSVWSREASGRFLVSATSGALPFRGSSPTRRGGRSPCGCRCI